MYWVEGIFNLCPHVVSWQVLSSVAQPFACCQPPLARAQLTAGNLMPDSVTVVILGDQRLL
jgi:hypothetical protein